MTSFLHHGVGSRLFNLPPPPLNPYCNYGVSRSCAFVSTTTCRMSGILRVAWKQYVHAVTSAAIRNTWIKMLEMNISMRNNTSDEIGSYTDSSMQFSSNRKLGWFFTQLRKSFSTMYSHGGQCQPRVGIVGRHSASKFIVYFPPLRWSHKFRKGGRVR